MLGTDFKGHEVTQVLVEELLPIAREFYTSILLDRSTGGYLAMMTAEGGVDIETLAAERPEALRRVGIDPALGLRPWHVRELTATLPPDAREGAGEVLRKVWDLLGARDLTLVEVNPLVQLDDGAVVALDAKVTVDDNALFRHPDLEALSAAVPDRPGRGARQRGRPAVREARRRGRDHRQRRRSRDVDPRRGRAGGRPRGELPRRRGWRERREDGDLPAGRPVRPRRAVRVHQHLRRDHAVRRGRRRHPRGARPGGRRTSRSSCGSTGRTPRRGAGSSRRRRTPGSSRSPRWTTRPPRPHGWRVRPRERPRRRRRPGFWSRGSTGSEGTFHTLRNRAYGTQVVAGVTPGKAGQDVEGIPVFDTVADAVRDDGRGHVDRSSCRRGSPPTRSSRPPTPA